MDEHGTFYSVLHGEPSRAGDTALVLTVQAIGDVRHTTARRYGLTRREAHIAELLARRATNSEIAQEMGISRHTARHHTERVLAKMGVTSRAAVRQMVFEAIARRVAT